MALGSAILAVHRGYIEERGKGVYRLRVDAGKDPVTGKRRQSSKTIRITGPRPDPTMTYRVYAEFIPENDRAAARIMGDLLDGELPDSSNS